MVSVREWQMEQLQKQLEQARALGHDVDQPFEQVKVSGSRLGVAAVCSCGWRSSPKSKRIKAVGAAMVHVGIVTGMGEAHPVTDPVPGVSVTHGDARTG